MHIRLVNVYLLNVPSVSSPYFNKIKQTSHLGKWHALSLEILMRSTCCFYSCGGQLDNMKLTIKKQSLALPFWGSLGFGGEHFENC